MNMTLEEIRFIIDAIHEKLDNYLASVNAGNGEFAVEKAKLCIDLIYKFRILEEKKIGDVMHE